MRPKHAVLACNILIIWGDDIGGFNISAYNMTKRVVDFISVGRS